MTDRQSQRTYRDARIVVGGTLLAFAGYYLILMYPLHYQEIIHGFNAFIGIEGGSQLELVSVIVTALGVPALFVGGAFGVLNGDIP